MAINETVRNLDVNPNVTKTVTLDLQKIIPTDTEGDEIYVTSAATTATSQFAGATVNTSFLREFKAGYSKSSGQANGPFTIDASNNELRVQIDGSLPTAITLSQGTGLTAEDIANDLQTQISAQAGVGGSREGNLGYLNATVEFRNGRFRIISGTVSNTYTGVGKSSVTVLSGANDATPTLGFYLPVESEALSAKSPTETVLVTTYSGGDPNLNVESVDGFAVGEAFTISDGTNREYFVASGIDSGSTLLGVSGSGLANTYSGGAIVQRIYERDPDSQLASPYEDIDALIRFQLRSIANQLDYTS